MASARFLDTLQKLSAAHRKRIEDELSLWKTQRTLKANPKKHKGRPELVHSQITGQSLVFPYFLSV